MPNADRDRHAPELFVIASQRVGTTRRPMTGSAKQSGFTAAKDGLLRRYGPRNNGRRLGTLKKYLKPGVGSAPPRSFLD
jgi:hypothetical protein